MWGNRYFINHCSAGPPPVILARSVDFCCSWSSGLAEFLCVTQQGDNMDQQGNGRDQLRWISAGSGTSHCSTLSATPVVKLRLHRDCDRDATFLQLISISTDWQSLRSVQPIYVHIWNKSNDRWSVRDRFFNLSAIDQQLFGNRSPQISDSLAISLDRPNSI